MERTIALPITAFLQVNAQRKIELLSDDPNYATCLLLADTKKTGARRSVGVEIEFMYVIYYGASQSIFCIA